MVQSSHQKEAVEMFLEINRKITAAVAIIVKVIVAP